MRKGMAFGVLTTLASIIGVIITALVLMDWSLDSDSPGVLYVLLMVFLVGTIVGMLIAIAYSEEGFRVEGSTLEWMIAAMLSPAVALSLFFESEEKSSPDYIDIHDDRRLSKL